VTAELGPLAIPPLDEGAMAEASARQDRLTKPAGSLGRLEELSIRLAGMTGRLRPRLRHSVVFVLAADHGVAVERVSAYPQDVTAQMVANVLGGGAAINALAGVAGARVLVADFGVAADLPDLPGLRGRPVRRGTRDIAREPAMTRAEAVAAVEAGRRLVVEETARGLDVACTGELGIANTTASAALVCRLLGLPPERVVGRGTGLDDAGLVRKREVVGQALRRHADADGPLDVLAALGGLEIAGLAGVILESAARRVPVLLDGFIAGTAALVAASLDPAVEGYLLAAHRSQELGHGAVLAALGLRPLLHLDLRLGEGTGAVLALPLLAAAVAALNEMATFDEAAVSERMVDEPSEEV
jgi:nicotinate-nucleotide--dimethylbenzimidazole phosphoribosyltransferase